MSTIVMKEEIESVCDALCFSLLGSGRLHYAVCDRTAVPDILKASVDDMKGHIWEWPTRSRISSPIPTGQTAIRHWILSQMLTSARTAGYSFRSRNGYTGFFNQSSIILSLMADSVCYAMTI